MKKQVIENFLEYLKKNRAVGEGYQITDKNPSSTRNFANNNP